MGEEGKVFRIQCKAFLLTYNNVSGQLTFEDLKTFFENEENCIFSICEEFATRKHFHAFVQYGEKIDRLKSYYKIKNDEPDDVQTNQAKRNFQNSTAEGHFYCYCKFKYSHVQSYTTCKRKATCNAIYHLIQNGKMDISDALRCAKEYDMVMGLAAMQRNIDALKMLKQRAKMEDYNKWCREMANSAITRPFKKYTMVETFKQQFYEIQTRYNFLIIVGPSKLGKTEFAKQLFPRPLIFSQATNWKEYDPFEHDAIIFDDVSQFEDSSKNIFQYILNNKTLFQAGPTPITLGKSATDIFAYQVNVYKKPLIICCNHEAYQQRIGSWIETNSFTLVVDAPMYF